MICVVDYGVGNIQAFLTSLKRMGFDARRANTLSSLDESTRLILPGVGHFDHAMQSLNQSGLKHKLEELVIEKNIPILGVCVGMQMLSEGSEEGVLSGLNWVPGHVRSLEKFKEVQQLPLPHMGWNDISFDVNSKLFSRGFSNEAHFYFLHSFFFDAQDKKDVIATAYYGMNFDVVVSRAHITGVQFHPEKSHSWGAQLLKNFVEF